MLHAKDWMPLFIRIPQLFTPKECRSVIKAGDSYGMTPAQRIVRDGVLEVDPDFRKCDNAVMQPGQGCYAFARKRLGDKLAAINSRYAFEFYPDERLLWNFNVNRYEGSATTPGKLNWHADTYNSDGADQRKLSISILLNDPSEFEGGELQIMHDGHPTSVFGDAKAGDAVVFPSFAQHSVSPVTSGVRYTGVMWLMGPRFR